MRGQVILKRYVVTAELGQGAMGRVFLARDQQANRDVVIKLMGEALARQPRFRQQFQLELDCMRRLNHPGAVALLEGSLDDPIGPCLVMEHVRGQDLETLRKRQPSRRFSVERVGRLIGQLCEVLQAAHQLGIVHRDLKPGNLMVIDWGQPMERVKVIDFGLAKLAEEQRGPGETAVAAVRPTGAAGYISPEQIRGQPVDPRADLYSVGVVLFELLTGKLPFRKSSVAETIQAHLREVPPRFAAIDPQLRVPPAVEAVVQLCLAKEPSGRPTNAQDLGQRLQQALGQAATVSPVPAATPSAASPPPPSPALSKPKPTLPTMPGTPAVQRPSRATLHDVPPPAPEPDEATYAVAGFRPTAGSLASLTGFVKEVGGRLLEKSDGCLRALLPVHLCSATFQQGGAGSGSVQLILTELELRWERLHPERPLQLAFRPLGAISVSLANAWRGGCERMHAQIEACLQG